MAQTVLKMHKHAVIFWILFSWIVKCHSICSNEYGPHPVCRYVPAPPGKTPPCARPGLTYCEHPDHYPRYLIYHLIQKWQFNHKNLIIDEAKDEFSAFYYPPPSTVYGPPTLPDLGADGGYHYPEPVYIPKPTQVFPEQGGYYIPPNVYQQQAPQQNYTNGLNGYEPKYNKDGTFLTYKYSSFPQPDKATSYNTGYPSPGFLTPGLYGHVNGIWKRSERQKRSLRKRRYLTASLKYQENEYRTQNSTSLIRRKRQSTITGQPLCRSRSSFIMPRAALNSKGNWMYVVNMPESNQQYTQLVKSEVCSDTNCGGLCQLPQGYSSRCEQKYVQKRLIALEGSGNDLYSDTFWFPSCCICTISNT
ncbi:protein spaetzle 5-like [Sitophilus oryzae]|uniref:Protein spaetzle 5-like n=1 Tax=Sitophilus oryzae TaxID=7048 RepID=A0A6J2YUY6_SITOR|nr:protein spaetzle 5-like [Sitophilus oryzae]